MRRLLAILVVLAVIAVIGAAAFVVRPSLADKEADVDERWEPIAAALGPRYDALGILATTVSEVSDTPREVVGETLEEVGVWWRSVGVELDEDAGAEATGDEDADVEEQVVVANRLEGLAARLEATVRDSSRLSGDEHVVDALERLDAAVVPAAMVEAYNDAVRSYDDARRSVTGQPVAAVFGFDARTAFKPVHSP